MGEAEVGAMLQELGATVAATQAPLQGENGEALTRALAQRLDALGYEAVPARHGDDWQVEAFNCVFHSLARQHPQVCKFDLAYMEAATGRRVHHVECMIRGGQVCRSEEHTSELQSLMRISYAVFCLKKKTITQPT